MRNAAAGHHVPRGASPVGRLIQAWRHSRRKSQLALALEAGISARHLGFLEVGRSQPSREMVLLLADALDVPLRERNTLLVAAGYAPLYRETGLTAPELGHAHKALRLILDHHEPFPAVVMDPHWNLILTNQGADRFFERLLPAPTVPGPPNVVRLMFDPQGLRPFVANWEEAAGALLRRVHREALGGVPDEVTERLLDEVLAFPDVPRRWRTPESLGLTPPPLVAIQFRKDELAMDWFSTVTTLGTPQDITLQEMRIECFFPANAETEAAAHALARAPRPA
jgi:transcriptional regulator with XRE-family HTH domain